jgi:hypothetical protein
MTETWLAMRVCDLYAEKSTLSTDSARKAIAGRMMLKDQSRTGASDLRAR